MHFAIGAKPEWFRLYVKSTGYEGVFIEHDYCFPSNESAKQKALKEHSVDYIILNAAGEVVDVFPEPVQYQVQVQYDDDQWHKGFCAYTELDCAVKCCDAIDWNPYRVTARRVINVATGEVVHGPIQGPGDKAEPEPVIPDPPKTVPANGKWQEWYCMPPDMKWHNNMGPEAGQANLLDAFCGFARHRRNDTTYAIYRPDGILYAMLRPTQ